MVRVRKRNGETVDLTHNQAVEVVDSDGRLGMVVLSAKKDTVRVLVPGDPLFTGYCRTNGIEPAKVHFHEPFEGSAMGG